MTEAMLMAQLMIMWVHLMTKGKKKQEQTCVMVHLFHNQLLHQHAHTCTVAFKVNCRDALTGVFEKKKTVTLPIEYILNVFFFFFFYKY